MAIDSTASGYTNVGRDITLSIIGPDSVVIVVDNVMSFDYRQITADITHMRMNGSTLVADLPKLWEGTVEFQRRDATVETAIRAIQDQWLGNQDYILGTLAITVASQKENATYTFHDVSVKLEDTRWKGDDATTSKLQFRASTFKAG